MERGDVRTRFQGVWNVVRFNWPYYALALAGFSLILGIRYYVDPPFRTVADGFLIFSVFLTMLSLMVSWYVYDHAGFYRLDWLSGLESDGVDMIVNINAGFDETSSLLKSRFTHAEMIVCDFYDPAKHTEASIRRARKAYPPFPGTLKVTTNALPINDGSADMIFAIFSAHEIRDPNERDAFFSELSRALSDDGRVVIVEHPRDAANYFAYNLGAFHFHTRASWLSTFAAAKLEIEKEMKLTPFVSAFFLRKHGTAS